MPAKQTNPDPRLEDIEDQTEGAYMKYCVAFNCPNVNISKTPTKDKWICEDHLELIQLGVSTISEVYSLGH